MFFLRFVSDGARLDRARSLPFGEAVPFSANVDDGAADRAQATTEAVDLDSQICAFVIVGDAHGRAEARARDVTCPGADETDQESQLVQCEIDTDTAHQDGLLGETDLDRSPIQRKRVM